MYHSNVTPSQQRKLCVEEGAYGDPVLNSQGKRGNEESHFAGPVGILRNLAFIPNNMEAFGGF